MGKDLEPRQAPKRSVDMFLDLAATEEDHDEVNNVVSALIFHHGLKLISHYSDWKYQRLYNASG